MEKFLAGNTFKYQSQRQQQRPVGGILVNELILNKLDMLQST